MLIKTTHLELPRRVTAYYLLFGLAAIAWLTVGVIVVSQALLSSRDDSACITELGHVSTRVAAELLSGGAENLQPLVEELAAAPPWAHAALSIDGRFLAHSATDRVGQAPTESASTSMQWGDVERISWVDQNSQVLREYRTPIRKGAQTLAILHMAVPDPGMMSVVRMTAAYAPLAILGPMMLMGVGAIVLQRMVRPMAAIESQLNEVAVSALPSDVALRSVPAAGPAGIGWNRLIEGRAKGDQKADLGSRLAEAVEGFRNRKSDQILNSLPDGVALTDGDGKITFVNQPMAALLNTSVEAMTGKRMADCLSLAPTDTSAASLLDPEMQARPVVTELTRSADAGQGILRIARQPLRSGPSSESAGHVWSLRDITQQKLADQMRSQFVNSATHELRTPLANIKAYAETLVLTEMLDVERQKEFCNTINSEATRLARFIDDLLSISSMEVGSLSLSRQETDMERLFREAIEKMRPQMVKKRLEFQPSLPEKLPKLKIDKDKITATLVNLVGNAVKYTPEGGQVRFKVQNKPDHLQIDIEDTGIGISAQDVPKLFEKFFRSADPRVQEQTGSGLGLSLAQEVVRLHGGKLSVQSEINQGTRFTITLPLV